MPALDLSFASGESSLSVRRFAVHEGLSTLFSVAVWARSPDPSLALDTLVGQPASLRIEAGIVNSQASARVWSGVVSYMELSRVEASAKGLSTYHLVIVPRLWLLTQRINYRIYQHLSIPDIATKLLAEWDIEGEWRIDAGKYPKLEYKIQYEETDYDFLSRLLEEAGITLFFDDQGGEEAKLVLGDAPQKNEARKGGGIHYVDNPSKSAEQEFVTQVHLAHEVRPGAHVIRDVDFRNPSFALTGDAPKATGPEALYEQYSYQPGALLIEPGKGGDTPFADDRGIARFDKPFGDGRAERALLAERQGRRAVTFDANVVDLRPGTVFSIDGHAHPELDGKTLLVTGFSLQGSPGGEWTMTGTAVFTDVAYLPQLKTARPQVVGVQTATVVGPTGEEIHTDEFGRVRVQFPWDREGKMNEEASCWMHVSQGWGGRGYGMINLPRIGQEVLVGFLEGDPDRPTVVARVYNQTQPVPYKLPENKTISTWKSDSSLGGDGFNEIKYEDKKSDELVYIQAQKNLRKLVKHDETITVLNDRSKNVGVNETDTTLVNRSEFTGVNRSQTIGENRMTFIVGKKEKLIKSSEIEITEGNRKLRVGKDLAQTVKGQKHERVEEDVHVRVNGKRSERIDQSQSLTVIVDQFEEVTGSHALSAGKEIHFSAIEKLVAEGNDVTLKGPGGFIRLNGAGITIVGTRVEINVSGTAGNGRGSKPLLPDDPKKAKIKTDDGDEDPDEEEAADPEKAAGGAQALEAAGGGLFDFLKKKKSKNVKLPQHATKCRGQMLVQQEKPMSCGQAASRMVIFSRTHKDVPEGTLRDESEKRANGYDAFNGTSTLDVPNMLGDHGVKGQETWKRGATVSDMDGALKQGKPAMVLLRDPGHFVVLDGIETKKDGTKSLLIRDPALPGKKGCRSIDVGGEEWNRRVADPNDPGWVLTLPH
jgi:type VI secretion system secreted protein VgrG